MTTRKLFHCGLKIEQKGGRFLISQNAADIIGVKEDEGLMFAVNRAERCMYVKKDMEEDSFYLRRKDKTSFRWTSKDLFYYFDSVFELTKGAEKVFYFNIESVQNVAGFFKITPYIPTT